MPFTTEPVGGCRDAGADLSQAALCYRDGDGEQRRYLLDEGRPRLLMGRGDRCDLALGWDDQVSREHAKLEPLGENWLLIDDGLSRNGTYVNGERLHGERRLEHRDRVLVGRTLLTFRAGRPPTGSSTVVPGRPLVRLTEAQHQVLRILCRPLTSGSGRGMPASNREIAAELVLSVETVKDHLSQLFVKFRLEALQQNDKRLTLARRAIETGMV